MPGRYDKPAAPPPSVHDVYHLLIDARPTLRQRIEQPDATEKRRAVAVRDLLTFARETVAKADETEPPPPEPRTRLRAMPEALREFLEIEGLRIFVAPDPVEALRRFLGRRKRGEHADNNEYRDRMITADVCERMLRGANRDDACAAVADACELSSERVLAIYNKLRDTLEIRAELGLREILRGKPFPEGRRVSKSANR